MAQHDYSISNNTGALFRADLNAAMQAVVTQNSGTTAPAVTFPGMLWLDLSGGGDGIMRRRNQANSAWINDVGIDQVARDAAAAAQATANAAMPRTGGTFTGVINLPAGTPTSNQAVSRTAADALYQVRLPATVAGTLLLGGAAGWTGTLAPGAAGTVLSMSAGLPTWQSTATVATANSIVRALPDGTIDPSFIPGVASGLKFCGTWKPVVNNEYPTTGGNGAGGAPTVGDFWVIDGLTTGGYTFLTGTLAGVTVYNGDSIAYAGNGNWYRMGSSVALEGYLKTDGSIAMAGNLNMGGFGVTNVASIAGLAGSPAPVSNLLVNATNVVISPIRGVSGPDLSLLAVGQIATDYGRMQLFFGNGASNVGLIPVRYFSANTGYVAGEHVVNGGRLYRAMQTISAGAFVASQWSPYIYDANPNFSTQITIQNADSAPALYLWAMANAVDSRRGSLYVEATTGDGIWSITNDTFAETRSGIRLRRSDNSILPLVTGGSLGAPTVGWSSIYNAGIMAFVNQTDCRVVCGGTGSAPNTARLLLLSTNSINNGGPFISLYANDYATTSSQGRIHMQTYGYPILCGCTALQPTDANTTSLGTLQNPWGNFYLGGIANLYADIRMFTTTPEIQMMSPAGLTASGKGYRILSNVSDADDTAFTIARWNSTTQGFENIYNYSPSNVTTTIASGLAVDGNVRPATDNTRSSGQSGQRWTVVYAVTGTINTSDAREKTEVRVFDAAELNAATAASRELGIYQWLSAIADKGEAQARLHVGTTAQRIERVLIDHGLDPARYGFWCHDAWDAIPGETEAGERYGLRYDELLAFLLVGLASRVAALEADGG